MKSKLLTFTLSITIIMSVISCQHPDAFGDFIDNESSALMTDPEIRSLSIGVIKDGKSYKFHKGKLLSGKRPNDKTLYEIASLTKTFTGTLLAKAILDNKVKLGDGIRAYLPEGFRNLEFDGHPITFRNLVTHTSGLPNMFPDRPEIFEDPNWDELPMKINNLQKGYTKSQFLEELRNVTLETIPGQQFGYSNVGANLLSYCLERMYQESYTALVKAVILDPLKLGNTYVGVSKENEKFIAKGTNINGIEMPIRAEKELLAEGGIISSLGDMIKYAKYQLEKDNPLIQTAHQELLDGKYGDFENGLFWQISKNGNKPTKIFQNGGAFGTSSWLTIVPETQTGIFIATNVSGPQIHQKLNMLADKIIDYSN